MTLPHFKLPGQQQHDRVSLEDAIRRYENGLLTATGYIYTITKIYRAKGHKLTIPKARDFYEYFKIPKSTFYRALTELENNPEVDFHWYESGGISMWWGDETQEEAPKELNYKRLNELPEPVRAEFEAFIRTEWRKIKREEIRSLHRFLEKPTDFQNWWQKFQQKPAATTAEAETETAQAETETAEAETETKPERVFIGPTDEQKAQVREALKRSRETKTKTRSSLTPDDIERIESTLRRS
ncbi:hypothetical protein QUB28_21810 [Microcoleus sp. B4-C3]